MRSLPVFLVTAAFVLGSALAAMAMPLPNCSKRVESFNFVVDYSGSMLMSDSKLKKVKIEVAKDLITSINDKIPAMNFYGGLYTVAPDTTVVPHGPWNRAALAQGVSKLRSDHQIFGRKSPIGDGMRAHEAMFASMSRNAAVILFSDGENNRGADPVSIIQSMYQSQPGLIVHVVCFAESPEGKATLERIAALNRDSIKVEAYDLATSEIALDNFVRDIFCAEDDVIVLRGVNFAFDSYALDSRATAILDEAAGLIRNMPGNIRLEGWTDHIGTDQYNMLLSQRRADAVMNHLVRQGVPASRLTAVGRGKSFKYDNSTDEGRFMNRRTEILTVD